MSLIGKIAIARNTQSTNLFAEREEIEARLRVETGGLGVKGIRIAAAGLEDPEILRGLQELEAFVDRVKEIDDLRRGLDTPLPVIVRQAEAQQRAQARAQAKADADAKAEALKAALAGLTPRQLPLARSFLRANPDFTDFSRLWKATERWKSMK